MFVFLLKDLKVACLSSNTLTIFRKCFMEIFGPGLFIVCTPPLSARGGGGGEGLSLQPNFQKGGGLDLNLKFLPNNLVTFKR